MNDQPKARRVLITRAGIGVNDHRRVYITGPWTFDGATVYSSTTDRTKASRFARPVAVRLVREKSWTDLELEDE